MSAPVAANEVVGGEEVARTTSAFQPDTTIDSPDTTIDSGVEQLGAERSIERTLRGRVADWPLTAVVWVIWALHRLWLALPPRASVAASPPSRDHRRRDERPGANARAASAPARIAGRRTAAVEAEACSLSESHES